MPRLEGFRVRGYRALGDVTLGRLWNTKQTAPLTSLVAVIGRNGAGKSTLFDAFGFLADCLRYGVEEACDGGGRGSFARIATGGCAASLQFEVYYRHSDKDRPITYEVSIALGEDGRPYVESERLRQRRKGQSRGRPHSFLNLQSGRGRAWAGESDGEVEGPDQIDVELRDPRRLGIATLGTLAEHPRIAQFREFVEGWYLSYFTPDAARSLPLAGPQRRLSTHGDNIGNVVQFMERDDPQGFRAMLNTIAKRIPGIRGIRTERSADGRLLLRFSDGGFADPFYAHQMSDGTLKMLAYLLLLADPSPPPFICIEEPENGLYHKLLPVLADEFRRHANSKGGPQVFVTTHQPYFVDALTPEEVWVLEKAPSGVATIAHASDDPTVRAMVEEGRPLGSLWFSDYLDEGMGEDAL